MDAIKKEATSPFKQDHFGGPLTSDDAAAWWANWAKDHREQIDAYNKDVADNGIWSDGLRTF